MDEYWDEYGEFNEAIGSLRESLKTTVKKEITDELTKLRTENKELKGRVSNLDQLEKEAQDKVRLAQNKYDSAAREAAYMRADELFKYLEDTKYMVTQVSHGQDKCDKCNDERKLLFTYPSGKDGYEMCSCHAQVYQWEATPAIGTSVDVRDKNLRVWYKPFSTDDNYHSMSGDIRRPYNGEDFGDLAKANIRYGLLFNDEETAGKYADWLNTKGTL